MENSVRTLESAAASQPSDVLSRELDRLKKNGKFKDLLTEKVNAIVTTPEVEAKIRATSSQLLDSKQFDSKNLSSQAKQVIKVWAKSAVTEDLVKMISDEAVEVAKALKQELINIIPTPQDVSFSTFVTKKTMGDALMIIQKQMNEFQTFPNVLELMFGMWIIKAIFIEIHTAATLVLE